MIARFSLALVLAATVSLTGCKPGQTQARAASAEPQAVEVAQTTRRDLEETLNVVGSLAANESASIRAEISGQVKQVFFEEGQQVTKGQMLLKIDDSELRAQFAQSEARFKLAELNLTRNESLVQSRTISQADFDRAQTEFAASSAELAVLRVRLDRTEIRAPFDGVVGSRSVSPGDYVTPASTITQIDDLSRLKIDFQVPERFLNKLKHGLRFTLQSRSIESSKPVEGEVYFVSSVIDRTTRSSEVKGFLSDPPSQLRPGMFANVQLVLDVRRNVLTVPEGAILSTSRGPQVIVARTSGSETVAEFVPVTLGLRTNGWVEVEPVKGELPDQQSIVAAGVGSLVLFPGAKLIPRPLRKDFGTGGET